jgi:hypothetical protein
MGWIRRFPWVLLVVAGGAGCEFDEQYTGLGEKALPGDPLNPILPDVQGGTCAPSGPIAVDLTGMAWRFDSLALTLPTDALNDLFFKTEIEKGTMNVLLVADAFDKDASTLTMRLGGAVAEGEAYRLEGETGTVPGTLDGARFETSSQVTLPLPGKPFLEPPVLRVTRVTLSCSFASDGSAITGGELKGVLAGADAAATKFSGVDLGTLLSQFGKPPTRDDEPAGAPDGKPDSWDVEGTFAAKRVGVVK